MLSQICAEIKNYFAHEEDRYIDDWTIEDGIISPSLDFKTDYIRIIGSHLNDGVYKVSNMTLRDESFHGAIWLMSLPADFLALAEEIKTWQDVNGKPDSSAMSPFYSESFGGYSYTKSAGSVHNQGASTTWQSVYASRLNMYRKIREL